MSDTNATWRSMEEMAKIEAKGDASQEELEELAADLSSKVNILYDHISLTSLTIESITTASPHYVERHSMGGDLGRRRSRRQSAARAWTQEGGGNQPSQGKD